MEVENMASGEMKTNPEANGKMEKNASPEKKNKKMLILSIILVALLIVGAVYFLMGTADNSQSSGGGTNVVSPENPEQIIENSITDNENAVDLGELI